VEKVLKCPMHNFLDQIGDYWLLFLLSRNLSPIAMKELFAELEPVMAPEPINYNSYPSVPEYEKESQM